MDNMRGFTVAIYVLDVIATHSILKEGRNENN